MIGEPWRTRIAPAEGTLPERIIVAQGDQRIVIPLDEWTEWVDEVDLMRRQHDERR